MLNFTDFIKKQLSDLDILFLMLCRIASEIEGLDQYLCVTQTTTFMFNDLEQFYCS